MSTAVTIWKSHLRCRTPSLLKKEEKISSRSETGPERWRNIKNIYHKKENSPFCMITSSLLNLTGVLSWGLQHLIIKNHHQQQMISQAEKISRNVKKCWTFWKEIIILVACFRPGQRFSNIEYDVVLNNHRPFFSLHIWIMFFTWRYF